MPKNHLDVKFKIYYKLQMIKMSNFEKKKKCLEFIKI